MKLLAASLLTIALVALAWLTLPLWAWLSVRRSRIVEPEPCSDYDGEG